MIYGSSEKVEELLKVMEFGFGQISAVAEEYGLPVIDLSQTFDPSNAAHYGTTEIEPSNESGQFIVDLVRHVAETFAFGKDQKSMVYYGLKGSIKSGGVADERKGYLQAMRARNKEL